MLDLRKLEPIYEFGGSTQGICAVLNLGARLSDAQFRLLILMSEGPTLGGFSVRIDWFSKYGLSRDWVLDTVKEFMGTNIPMPNEWISAVDIIEDEDLVFWAFYQWEAPKNEH